MNDDNTKHEEPDIFRAALNDDPAELSAALATGQSLNDISSELNGMTPIHYACFRNRTKFLDAAMLETFNPWIEDQNGRRAIDIARIQNLSETQASLLSKMYPDGPAMGAVITFEP